jgi:hypothetical protein
MNKQQTAVEWLVDKFSTQGTLHSSDISQAKAMEKEQMIEFAQEVFRNRYNQITQSLGNIADDIYKETYGE